MRTLALHQWRRNKGSFLGFGAIILIAACMLGSALTLLCTVGPRYTALADELHTADVDIVVPRAAATADVCELINGTAGVGTIEPHAVLLMDAQIHDFRGTDFAIRTMITDADAPRTLNQTRVLATAAGGGDLTIAQYTGSSDSSHRGSGSNCGSAAMTSRSASPAWSKRWNSATPDRRSSRSAPQPRASPSLSATIRNHA